MRDIRTKRHWRQVAVLGLLRHRRLSASLLIAAILLLTVVLFSSARRREDEALRTAFEDRARTLASAVRVSCDGHLEVLDSLAALFSSVPTVSREEFSRFVTGSLRRHPGIRGLSWDPRIDAASRARFEAESGARITEIDAQGRRGPAAPRAEYVVVEFIEPPSDLKALGLDVSSEPVRRDALVQARDTGQTAASGPIQLVNDQVGQLSVLVFAPVYGVGRETATLEQRRREIRGYATGAFRLGNLVETALRDLPRDGVTVALFDHQESMAPKLLYEDAPAGEAAGGLVWRDHFEFGGRPWEVRVAAKPAFAAELGPRRSWWILLGGSLFTALLGAFLFVVTARAAKVEELVVRRTAELQNELRERQRAEGVVRVSEARNRALLDNMLGGMLTFNEQSRIESVNPAAERIVGYREDELIGKSLAVLIADAPDSDPEPYLRETHRQALGRVTETWGRRKNGEIFPTEVALFKFKAPEGRRFACNFQDVSERREVDRLKSEFVSTVSHELRTPLTSIRGSLGLLAGGVLGTLQPQIQDLVRLAERNAVRLTALINDILDFERLDRGQIQMQIADVDLQPLFEQSLESVRPVADEQRIALVCSPTGLRLRVDAVRIVQILVNLLSNAIKFSPCDREVRVWAEEKDDGWVRVLVQDQGPGIPDSHQQRIFERFAQVETADNRYKGGTGLGLAICKAIVEHHGGSIGVDSEPGVGSTFWFELPSAR
ncbi:MAG TPA: CHASE domain-containing protein [Thermoanaerobaculia bacterium]|nr:CHASE domain-containing protein [Thermoanaerobaculia bacterium]